MPNVNSAINRCNKFVLKAPGNTNERTCSCINKTKCPFQEKEKYLANNILYKARLTSDHTTDHIISSKKWGYLGQLRKKLKIFNKEKKYNKVIIKKKINYLCYTKSKFNCPKIKRI